MDKIKYRTIIEFLTKEHCQAANIHERLVNVYGNSAPSLATVKNWMRLAVKWWERDSLEDEQRCERPSTAVTEDNVKSVENQVLEDRRRISVRRIADILGIAWSSCSTNHPS